MKIREREKDGNLKNEFIESRSRFEAEKIKGGEKTIEEVPIALREEVQGIIQQEVT